MNYEMNDVLIIWMTTRKKNLFTCVLISFYIYFWIHWKINTSEKKIDKIKIRNLIPLKAIIILWKKEREIFWFLYSPICVIPFLWQLWLFINDYKI
jgi:hypothetical protein